MSIVMSKCYETKKLHNMIRVYYIIVGKLLMNT